VTTSTEEASTEETSTEETSTGEAAATSSKEPRTTENQTAKHAKRLARLGWGIVVFAILPIGAWMALAPLSMAVVAPALIKVDLNRRPVQHLEGGIVREVMVRNGQVVKTGDPILAIGSVGVDADRNRLLYRVQVERASQVRLTAEQSRSEALTIPAELSKAARKDERVRQAILKETSLFEAGLNSLTTETALMKKQRENVQQEIAAVNAQLVQSEHSLKLQKSVYEANQRLVEGGYISTTRLTELEASLADYDSKLEQQRSELARARQRSSDIDLRIKSIENTYVRAASDQLRETSARLMEIEQELRKSVDVATRQLVLSPADGEVIDLKFTSVGAVLRAGESIAEIVPSAAKLMVEARIRPEDINNVHRDQPARVKLTSFKYRNSAMVTGKVTYVSADRLVERDLSYYTVMIAADDASLTSAGDLKLQAGMPAEVYIEGSKRTPLQYLAEPLTNTVRKAGRQM
jgi:membrane fusion protein, epimerase transport system